MTHALAMARHLGGCNTIDTQRLEKKNADLLDANAALEGDLASARKEIQEMQANIDKLQGNWVFES